MRNLSKFSAALLLSLTLGAAALSAQTAPAAAGAPTAAVAPRPNLTAEQRQKLAALRASARDQAAVLRHDTTLTAEQREAKLKELRATTHEQMKAVLTPEQQKAVAAHREARKEHMAARLGLTADQQSKMKALFISSREQRKAVLDNSAIPSDQKIAQLAEIREQSKQQLATILSPEQLQKFEQMRQRQGARHAHTGAKAS